MKNALFNIKFPLILVLIIAYISVDAKAGVDLKAYHLTVTNRPSDNIFFTGGTVRVGCSVENVGNENSGPYSVSIYASEDLNCTPDDYNIGGANRSGTIEPDTREGFNITCRLPEDMPEEYYSIWMVVNYPDDTNPDNNVERDRWASIRVLKPRQPEISALSVNAADGIYQPDDSIIVNVDLEAGDGQLQGSCDVEIYASADQAISTNDYKIGSFGLGSLMPEESYSNNITCQLPSDIPFGSYYICIFVTYQTNEGSKNKTALDSSPVYVGEPSDLVVQFVDANDGTYVDGDQIVVYSLIENIGQQVSESYTVDYYASIDSDITATDYKIGSVNRSALASSEQHSHNTTCQLPSNIYAANLYIGIIVTCSNDTNLENNNGYDAVPVEITYPQHSIAGQIKYHDREGQVHPVRYALIEIYEPAIDYNPLGERFIGQTNTDHNGHYIFDLLNDDQINQEIFIKVYTEGVSGSYPETTSKICCVKDDVSDETYYLESIIYPNFEDLPVVIDMIVPPIAGEFMVYDSVVEGFHKVKTLIGIELPEITIYWPSSENTTFYDPCSGIFISQDDTSDRDVILREYGRYISDIYGFAQGDIGNNPLYEWDVDLRGRPYYRSDRNARNIAFREAWAFFFSVAIQYGDNWYPNSGDTWYQDRRSGELFEVDMERGNDDQCTPGEFYVNMNCCALWDIFDDDNSEDIYFDLLSDTSFEKIWTILRDYQPETIKDFWNSWFEIYNYENYMDYIFREHQMQFQIPVTPPPNQAPVAKAGPDQTVEQTYSEGAPVRLDGSGSFDPDSDPITLKWKYFDPQSLGGWVNCSGTHPTPTFPPGTTTITLTVSDGELSDQDTVNITVIPTDPGTWIIER